MSDAGITFHVFSNGRGFIDLGPNVRPEQVEAFKKWWTENKDKDIDRMFFGGAKVTVVEHPMPFGDLEVRE